MAELVQTHAAPDLLSFDETAEGHPVARIGRKTALITPLRDTLICITREDLRALLKEAYCLGWAGKCVHVKTLLDRIPAEIGT